jgi:hypothetical protein
MKIMTWTLGIGAAVVAVWALVATFTGPRELVNERIPVKQSPTVVMPTSYTCPNGVTYPMPEGPCPRAMPYERPTAAGC